MHLQRMLAAGFASCFLLTLVHSTQLAQSQPAPKTRQLAQPATQLAQNQSAKPDGFYQKAKKELPEDYYMLYRVIDRLARANGLDNQPWRVYIPSEYNINAFATNANLLAFYSGLLDQIDNDADAIACVAGHEMAHHTQKHIPTSTAEQQRILKTLRQQAVDEVAQENADLRADLNAIDIGGWVGGNVLRITDLNIRTDGLLGGIVGSVLQNQRQQRLQRGLQRIEQISAEKEAKIKQEWRDLSYRHEFEADKFGYQYMVRAGFNPQGCITLMNVFERLPNDQIFSETHPSTSARISAIRSMSSQYPTSLLVNEGKARLAANSKPLTYGLSRDQKSLRINSRTGSSDSNLRFPQ